MPAAVRDPQFVPPPRGEIPPRPLPRPARRPEGLRETTSPSFDAPRGWRKRVGVEPTKDRLAAPPGFEVRTPHRGRFPSTVRRWRLSIRRAAEQVEPVLVDAAQIAAPQRDAVTVEKFEDLDGDLAAVVEPVAEFGGGELPGRRLGREIGGRFHHLRHGAAKKEMIVGHLVDLAEAGE